MSTGKCCSTITGCWQERVVKVFKLLSVTVTELLQSLKDSNFEFITNVTSSQKRKAIGNQAFMKYHHSHSHRSRISSTNAHRTSIQNMTPKAPEKRGEGCRADSSARPPCVGAEKGRKKTACDSPRATSLRLPCRDHPDPPLVDQE